MNIVDLCDFGLWLLEFIFVHVKIFEDVVWTWEAAGRAKE